MKIGSEAELAEVMRVQTAPLSVRGGGTRGLAAEGAALDVTGLSGITLHEPGALTLVARAGTPLAEVEAVLAEAGQRLAFEPGDWRGLLAGSGTATIGGVAAANISGPRRVRAGAARDALLGVRFVDGTGALVKNGGRVMKNVTGYDLVKLMAGSHGTLGVLTEVAFKVLPVPQAATTLCLPGLDCKAAVAAMTAALGSPFDVTGAAWLPDGQVLIRIEGFAASVGYRAGRLSDLLRPYGVPVVVQDKAQVRALWQGVRDVAPFHDRRGDVWRFSIRAADAPAIAARLGGELVLDWGGGLIWALLPEGSDARARAAPYRGHATLIRAGQETRARIRRFEPEASAVARLTAGLRAKFDPKGILNPGLMG